jgi:hypothetical protein
MKKETAFQVIVGNIGTVYDGNNFMQASCKFSEYVKQSKTGYGRAGGEDVTLMHWGEPRKEHAGSNGIQD